MPSVAVLAEVRAALRQRLRSLPWLLAQGPQALVAWEGTAWPVGGARNAVPHLRDSLRPNTSRLIALGPFAPRRTEGLYLIDAFVPAQQNGINAVALADRIAGELLDHFAPNLQLTYDGQVTTVRHVYPSPALVEAQWRQQPVTVEWYADTVNVL